MNCSYEEYRRGKLDAYEDALLIISEVLEWKTGEDAIKRIKERLERHVAWNKEELERLAEQEGATK